DDLSLIDPALRNNAMRGMATSPSSFFRIPRLKKSAGGYTFPLTERWYIRYLFSLLEHIHADPDLGDCDSRPDLPCATRGFRPRVPAADRPRDRRFRHLPGQDAQHARQGRDPSESA